MSLAPAIDPRIRGVEGKPRPVETVCCVPGCISLSQQGHHLWPRSFLRGQPYDWVRLPSGRVISNVIGLCMRHHNDVTGGIGGHRAGIRLESDESFIWLDMSGEVPVNVGLLFPQPWSTQPVDLTKSPSASSPESHSHPNLDEGETCSTCGYTRPRKRVTMPRRETKTYGLVVPDDAEIGAEVLDEWVQQIAVILGFGDDVSKRLVRYHTIVAALAWTMQHRQQFIEDIKEAAEA